MILVTGGTGLVGSHLLRLLVRQGESVRAIRRASSDMRLVADIASQVEWVTGDVTDVCALYDAMKGIKTVYHAAAMVSFLPRDRDGLYAVNVQGTANIVNMALEIGVERLLYFSSIAALGRRVKQQQAGSDATWIDENTDWEESPQNSEYAKSKNKAELEVWRGIAEGLPAIIVCPSIILGEGDWQQGSSKLFQQLYKGQRFYPTGATGFVDVLDVVRMSVALMSERAALNQKFILNGANSTYRHFMELAAQFLEKTPPIQQLRPWQAAIAWRWEAIRAAITGNPPLLTRETTRTAASTYAYSNEKVIALLQQPFTPLPETIARISAAFRRDVAKGLV